MFLLNPSNFYLKGINVFLFTLIVSVILAPIIIHYLKRIQKYGQPIRTSGPESHLHTKKNTPTMGALIMLSPTILVTILYLDLTNIKILSPLLTLVSFACLGAVDDIKKILLNNSQGISSKTKILAQVVLAILNLYILKLYSDSLSFSKTNFFSHSLIDFGLLYMPFAVFTIVGASNAVNLTDGLDGLVAFPIIIALSALSIISYYDNGPNDIILFCIILMTSTLVFLWFNVYPAKVFMGDIGSLSIGAALAMISIVMKREFAFAIIGGLFVIEVMSVIIQVAYFKITGGKRIFLMTPIHHHFEKKGYSEITIVIRCWIISILLAVFAVFLVLYPNS